MSLESNKRAARRFIEEIVNTGNVEILGEVFSPDILEANYPTGEARGLDRMREHVLGVRRTWPDLHITIDRQIAEGDWVATCITARGTHLGEWLGITATGKQVTITGVNVDRFVDGKMVEHGGAANMFEALLEIGAIAVR
jgi:predicted ester cyclase